MNLRKSRTGQTAVILPLLLVLSLGSLYFFNYAQSMSSGLRYVTLKSYMHEHTNIIFENVAKHLAMGASTCLNLDQIYSFNSQTPVVVKTTSLDLLGTCLVGEKSVDIYDHFSLELMRLPSAQDILGETRVRVRLALRTRQMSSLPILTVNQEKVYNVRISSLAHFAVFFREQNGVMLKVPSGANLWIYGDVMKAGTGELKLAALSSPSYLDGDVNFEFLGKFYSQGSLEIDRDISAEQAFSVFKAGVFPNVMEDYFALPSMDSNPAWMQNIDYHYVYSNVMGYPLPADIPSAHGPGENVVNPSLAAVKSFPHPDIITSLDQTCESSGGSSRGDVKPMVIYQKDSDITLDLTNGKVFCGMIVAKTLTVKIPEDEVSGLIGHFNITNMVVEGKGHLYILNPFSSRDLPDDLFLPAGMTLNEVARQIFALKATVAKNFFIPFFKSSSGVPSMLKPTKVSSFFEPCGSNFCWKPDVVVFDYEDLYAQTDWFKNVRFFVEKTF